MIGRLPDVPHRVGSAVSADFYSSRLDALLPRAPLAPAHPLGAAQAECGTPAMRIIVIAATILAVFCAANLVYQVVRKPSEMFFPVSGAINKTPAEIWRQYAPLLFHHLDYSGAARCPGAGRGCW